jgi:ubiquinol-cytochrome c reductase cytochrome c subunit
MRFYVASAVVAASLILGAGVASAASAEKGREAFKANGCWQCHGFEGQGSAVTSNGKVLAPDPMPFETFEAFVRGTNRTMPPYREAILSKADLEDIYAFLQSVPQNKDVKDIPLLADIK